MSKKGYDREGNIIGGGVLTGIGAGFFLLEDSPLFFVASILIGLGLGLLISALVIKSKQ